MSYKATINGGIALGRASKNYGVVAQQMIPELQKGSKTYLRDGAGRGTVTATFSGWPDVEVTAHNAVGEPVDVPDWAIKVQRTMSY